MSSINGDKARFHRIQKARVAARAHEDLAREDCSRRGGAKVVAV
jgi:hypothetical protein